MSTPAGTVKDRIEVIDASGAHRAWVTEHEAHDMITAGTATCVWRQGKIRKIQALETVRHNSVGLAGGRGTGLDHTRYSTTKESETNPPRVWTLLRLSADLMPMRG